MTIIQAPANLFLDLATLISAGVSVSEAAKRIYTSYPNVERWPIAIAALEQGHRLSQALKKASLVSRYQMELISVSEDAGRLEQALRRLAEDVESRNRRRSKLKSKLLYPMAILVVGIFITSILSLVQNPQASIFVVCLSLTIKLILAYWGFKSILTYSQKGSEFWLSKLDNYQNTNGYRRHFQRLLFEVLYWHSCSGIDPKTSFSRISSLLDSKTIKKKLLKTANLCGQGVGISAAIRQTKLPLSSEALQIFSAGEHAGDIEGTLKKQLEIIQFETNLAIDNLTEWIPRVVYGIAMFFAIIAII